MLKSLCRGLGGRASRGRWLALGAALAFAATGCGTKGDTPELGQVEGIVKLDGQPLPEATVSFDPKQGGRTSTGSTDTNGHYKLNYTLKAEGARVGQHRVRVSTYQQGGDEPGAPQGVPEKVPAKYRDADTLLREVKAGKNTIDIELSSQ